MYKYIFLDLDDTLWDFAKNSHETLEELFEIYNLNKIGIIDCNDFIINYKIENDKLWKLYRENKITKDNLRILRFQKTLSLYNINDDSLANKISMDYINICPLKQNLMSGAIELLEYLKEKYSLTMVTNGFKEVQYKKIKQNNLASYFNHIICSEEVGFNKPNIEIFEYALNLNFAQSHECVMIGDSVEADIKGGINANIDCIFFNFKKLHCDLKIFKEVDSLDQIKHIL